MLWRKQRTPALTFQQRQRRLRDAVIQLGALTGRGSVRIQLLWYRDMLEDGHPFAQAMDDMHTMKGVTWED
jgi:hypothetical protein